MSELAVVKRLITQVKIQTLSVDIYTNLRFPFKMLLILTLGNFFLISTYFHELPNSSPPSLLVYLNECIVATTYNFSRLK